MNFYEKVMKVQSELKAPKGQYNSFGKYHYRSAEDILEAVKPLNHEYGLLLTLTDKPIQVGDRYYIEATATLTDGEQSITVNAYARESVTKKGMDDSQITGTASSYARKYALNGLYLIDDTKDADTDEYQERVNNSSKASDKQLNYVSSLLRNSSDDKKVQLNNFNNMIQQLKLSKDMTQWTQQQASQAIKFLKGGQNGATNSQKPL